MISHILDWPGKSALSDGGPRHPAVFHMIDVAAVAERLIYPFQFMGPFRDALVLLISLHDLGKVSDSFRQMIEDGKTQRFRHWQLTEALLYAHDDIIKSKIGGNWRQRQTLYASTAGHHGQPSELALGGQPGLPARERDYRLAIKEIGSGFEAAGIIIQAFCELWPNASLDGLNRTNQCAELSWWLPGLCAAADWIGSNSNWFPAEAGHPSLPDYLFRARRFAFDAVKCAGLTGSLAKDGTLFDFSLRPMQTASANVSIPDGPMLAVIEDETGAGKTEAALILAHRMIQESKGRGLYFALPTMATADAMFDRTRDIVGQMFEAPTLTLAHGRAGLSVPFRDIISSAHIGEDTPTCTDWLAESRRRALLADIGVGTIDQALMSVLPVKYQTLRHFGLSSKILIVDEVHEMGEAYVACELERLLQMHRGVGGSAILLTATLPLSLRARLLETYGGSNTDKAYPALTVARGVSIKHFQKDDRPRKGRIQVQRISHADEAIELLIEAAGRGAACVWVRNSVDDAIAAVRALKSRNLDARLLHARFALADRKKIETEVLARVGKNGGNRAGFVLVGTQVLEASLDLDFDVMVSDIAPIASLIQRAGRLWRHMDRFPASERPVKKPILHVLSPDPDQTVDSRWLKETLGSGAYVYSLSDVWRSARVLFKIGHIDAPQGLREMIEAVYGDLAEDVPATLQNEEMNMIGANAAAKTLASHNLVDLAKGYRGAGRGESDTKYPTRLGEETQTLVLARYDGDRLRPWVDVQDGWALSEVSARRNRLLKFPLPDQSHHAISAIKANWPEWKRIETIICPVAIDNTICDGLSYSHEYGLSWHDKK